MFQTPLPSHFSRFFFPHYTPIIFLCCFLFYSSVFLHCTPILFLCCFFLLFSCFPSKQALTSLACTHARVWPSCQLLYYALVPSVVSTAASEEPGLHTAIWIRQMHAHTIEDLNCCIIIRQNCLAKHSGWVSCGATCPSGIEVFDLA